MGNLCAQAPKLQDELLSYPRIPRNVEKKEEKTREVENRDVNYISPGDKNTPKHSQKIEKYPNEPKMEEEKTKEIENSGDKKNNPQFNPISAELQDELLSYPRNEEIMEEEKIEVENSEKESKMEEKKTREVENSDMNYISPVDKNTPKHSQKIEKYPKESNMEEEKTIEKQ